ncbi:head GIN domain-containing protein [Tellurirhabdus rosea]|uniref:head GIN domain-containing protein n=1 Tax=Tellurirhabdus rosea TaxID=2674997 RepID=UPI002251B8AC|nr:head GIN domain-containing protein [Tellurirhabdus rosea]
MRHRIPFRHLAVLCLVFLTATLTVSAQDGTRTFNFSNFDRLDMGSAFVINVSQGSSYKISATGRQKDLDDLEAAVVGNKTLRIRYKSSDWRNNRRERVTFTITMPSLSGVSFGGASKSTVAGFRNQKVFDIDISGASSSTIDVDATDVHIDVSGASSVTLAGKARTLKGDVSGATSLKAYDLKLESAAVEASGASNAQLFVTSRLQADASGASSIRYKGSPSVQSNTSGASSVRTVN